MPEWLAILVLLAIVGFLLWKFAASVPKFLIYLLFPIMLPAMMVGVILKAVFFWICASMKDLLPKDNSIQRWFEEKYLDLKYPSRVRRRKNKRHLGTE
jgi:hypothetical protein